MSQALLRVVARRAQAGVLSCGQVHHLLHSHSETTSVNAPRINLPSAILLLSHLCMFRQAASA